MIADTSHRLREHYSGSGLSARIEEALKAVAAEDELLTVAQLAPLDQFHLRGMRATAELAAAAGLDASSRVLDVGCGVGGPARYLAATFGCRVTGIDLSPGFIEAADYLTRRCGLSDRITFAVGDALHLPVADSAFHAVFLQHVAMNIADRAALYAELRRVLAPVGRFITYDVVLREGDVHYPVPWARDGSISFLLPEEGTRAALEQAGFAATLWRDDTAKVLGWLGALSGRGTGPLHLGIVAGPDFPTAIASVARNLRENRLGVLSAVLTRARPAC